MRVVTEAKNVQTGRSLTEMMGTLAIMGILILTGVRMYHGAMNRHYANTIINEAQKRAVVVAGQIGFQGRTDPSLGEFSDNEFAGGTFSTDVITDGLYQQFGIHVSNVPKAICQNILNSIGEGTAIRRLSPVGNPQTSLKSCQEENAFLLVYNNDASPTGGDVIYCDNSNCQTVCGECVSEDGENKCVNECPANQNTCSSNTDCSGECVGCVIPDGETQGTCQACQRVAYLESTGTERQYIDTGYQPTVASYGYDTKFIMTGKPTADPQRIQSFAITYKTWATQNPMYIYGVGTSFGKRVVTDLKAGNTCSSCPNVGWNYGDIINMSLHGNNLTYNGNSYTVKRYTDYSEKQSPVNLLLLARATPSSVAEFASVKLYYTKLYEGNSLIRDFVPVHVPFKETGKQNCLFDKVSKELFCNAASGADFSIP